MNLSTIGFEHHQQQQQQEEQVQNHHRKDYENEDLKLTSSIHRNSLLFGRYEDEEEEDESIFSSTSSPVVIENDEFDYDEDDDIVTSDDDDDDDNGNDYDPLLRFKQRSKSLLIDDNNKLSKSRPFIVQDYQQYVPHPMQGTTIIVESSCSPLSCSSSPNPTKTTTAISTVSRRISPTTSTEDNNNPSKLSSPILSNESSSFYNNISLNKKNKTKNKVHSKILSLSKNSCFLSPSSTNIVKSVSSSSKRSSGLKVKKGVWLPTVDLSDRTKDVSKLASLTLPF